MAVKLFITKGDMDEVEAGTAKQISLFREGQLHHLFGDRPMEYVVEVEITEKKKK